MIDAALAILGLALVVLFMTERRQRWERAEARALDDEWRAFCAWFNEQRKELRQREAARAPQGDLRS
jgi:hypothetical protein